jgi:hypothetical protein
MKGEVHESKELLKDKSTAGSYKSPPPSNTPAKKKEN